MADRPYTLLSCAVSLDGYLDRFETATVGRPLQLSNPADFDRVDAVRAASDAILVGAATVRNDNPRLLVRSAERRRARQNRGLSPSPAKVTLTRTGRLDPDAAFFAAGAADTLVYCPSAAVPETCRRVGAVTTVVDLGSAADPARLAEDLYRRGVRVLMVEGGGAVHTQFLTGDLADELQLVVAPFFVGDSRSRRFVGDGAFPYHPDRRATLAEVRQLDDVVLLRYALSPRFSPDWLQEA